MSWTINGQTPATLGVSGLQVQHSNLAAGSFNFRAPGRDFDASFLFSYGQVVTLELNGNTRWKGVCLDPQVVGRPGHEEHLYTVAGPWFYLEQLPYLQEWRINGGSEIAWLGRCILGVGNLGVRLTIGQVVTQVLTYAESCGLPVTAGHIDIAKNFPVEEVNGLSCAEVIRRVLRWAPNAAGWWDFATKSQFNVKRRSSLIAKSLTVGAAPLQSVRVRPRKDMKPSCVVLVYERMDTVDGEPVPQTATDVAPPGADGRQLNALQYTIPLAGGAVTTIKQKVEVRTIQTHFDGGNLQQARRYWGGIHGLTGKVESVPGDPHTPNIQFFALTDESPDRIARELENVSGVEGGAAYELADPADPESEKVFLNETLPRELIGGAIASWMSGVQGQRQLIRMKISFTVKGETKAIKPTIYTARMVATDATNRTYSKVDSVTAGETVATGLAAQMLADLSQPHYDGEITTLEEECSGQRGLGNVLNISGGRPEWQAMEAVIQQVTENIDTGETTYVVGPPSHLGPQDLTELQRCNRRPEGNTGQQSANVGRRNNGTL